MAEENRPTNGTEMSRLSRLPEELILRVASSTLRPNHEYRALTETPDYNHIDLSLLPLAEYRPAVKEALAKDFFFIEVCVDQCRGYCDDNNNHTVLDECQPDLHRRLLRPWEDVHVELSFIRITVACECVAENRDAYQLTRRVAFFDFDMLRALEICHTLSIWDSQWARVEAIVHSKGARSQLSGFVKDLKMYVDWFRPLDISIPEIRDNTHRALDLLFEGDLELFEDHISREHFINQNVAHCKQLQLLLDQDIPITHLVPLVAKFNFHNLGLSLHYMLDTNTSEPHTNLQLCSLLLNYTYIVSMGLAEYLLGARLAHIPQRHVLLLDNAHLSGALSGTMSFVEVVFALLLDGGPTNLAMQFWLPMFKAMGYLQIAFIRLSALPLTVYPPADLVSNVESMVAFRDTVPATIQELRRQIEAARKSLGDELKISLSHCSDTEVSGSIDELETMLDKVAIVSDHIEGSVDAIEALADPLLRGDAPKHKLPYLPMDCEHAATVHEELKKGGCDINNHNFFTA